LYPGESIADAPNFTSSSDYSKAIKRLPTVKADHAIRLRVILDFEDETGQHQAGDIYQLRGPLTYHPRPEAVCVTINMCS